MKKALSLVLALALVAALVPIMPIAANAESSGDWEYTLSMGDAIISGYNGTASNIVIPETIDGKKVVGIKASTFKDNYNLLSVTLPDSLEQIGSYAFQNCVNLTSITFPEKLETVGSYAFFNCKSLEKITVKSKKLSDYSSYLVFGNAGKDTDGIVVEFTDTVTLIPSYMFYGSDDNYVRVKSVTVGSAVTQIGSYAFYNCYDLQAVTLPQDSALESIGTSAFRNCVNLTSITFPEKLETVDTYAFENCESLEKITVKSKNLNDFSSYSVFKNAGKDTDGITVEFTDTVTRIPSYMFYTGGDNYARVKSVTIGSAVTEIDALAFCNCYDLQKVTLPQDSALKSIGTSAFRNCVNLTSITFPEKLETVDTYAFENCESLEKITVKSKELNDFHRYSVFENAGKETDGIVVEFTDTVTRIPSYMFYTDGDYARVKSVTIGSAITEIGDLAFGNCYDLQTITLPLDSALKSIGTGAFMNCVNLTNITFPEKLETVDTNAFYNCYDLQTITIKPNSALKSVGYSAFYECSGLQDVYYGGSMEQWNTITIGDRNEDLTNATIHFNSTLPKNPFSDVPSEKYYYAPVLWAVDKGVTTGMTSTTFVPDGTCTRAQIVTFLWRANGSPAPKSSSNPFRDVSSNDYYYKAVLWAVEKGITNGLTATTFGPNKPCTRGQVATFLWRSQGQPSTSGTNIFRDVASGAYYYKAVLWAVANGITNGMGNGTFAPDETCTRGQIVTFLYRAMNP